MPATTVDDERTDDDESFTARVVSSTERAKTVCGYFEPGLVHPRPRARERRDRRRQVGPRDRPRRRPDPRGRPSSVVAVPAGEDRGVEAGDERLEAVLVTAPPPTDAEHESVRHGLREDEFEP